MDDEQCPKCGSLFPAQRAWAHRTIAALLIPGGSVNDLDTRVRCPNCGHVFDARAFRFFGFVPPRVLRIVVTVFIAGMVAGILYSSFVLP